MCKKPVSFLKLILLLFVGACSHSDNFIVLHQVTGPGETNTYLMYDVKSKEAALFDVGGSIDTLESVIAEKGLELKYIFITHCHVDHVYGVPIIRKRYPEAKLCFSKEEWEDTKRYSQWENELDPDIVAKIKAGFEENPESEELMNFNFKLLGNPDIYLTDNQVIRLGYLKIRTLLSPGHSRGSICFYIDDVLFSGDLLFYRSVGRTDLPTGSKEDIIKSVRRLYTLLKEETKVYPGHGQFTDIDSEKKENKYVTIDGGKWGN